MSPLLQEPPDAPVARPDAGGWPTVSVIIPAYNAGAFLREAVESTIAQTVPEGEVLHEQIGGLGGRRRDWNDGERTEKARRPGQFG